MHLSDLPSLMWNHLTAKLIASQVDHVVCLDDAMDFLYIGGFACVILKVSLSNPLVSGIDAATAILSALFGWFLNMSIFVCFVIFLAD